MKTDKKRLKLRYPHQRAEQRRTNNINKKGKGERERKQMERQSKQKFSIGTLTFFKPKSNAKIGEFTLAFSKPLRKSEVYPILSQIFNGNLIEESVKSVFVKLKTPVPLRKILEEIKRNFDELL